MAVRDKFARSLPGRLVGVSVDADGNKAYRLALQTREQHIRREKATSNICTAQVLLAVMAGMYAVYHGPEGLRTIARRTHRYAAILAEGLRAAGVDVVTGSYFDTLTVRVPGKAGEVVSDARERGVNLRLVDADTVSLACDETTTRTQVAAVWAAFGADGDVEALDATAEDALPEALLRDDAILTHPVFHQHRSETAMLRYLRKLADRDYALDRGMIPLGSCTMKLNATAEMESITWPEFGALHPFAPAEQAQGFLTLIRELEERLAEVTGYDAVSLQPNSRLAGRVRGAAGRPRVPPRQRRREPHRLPDPVLRARHQRGECRDGRHEGGRRQDRRRRRGRHRGPARQDRAAPRRAGRAHDHLPVDARRLRGARRRHLRRGARHAAARSTSTVPTSTRWWAWPSPAGSAATSRT